MSVSDDIGNLFRKFGGNADAYQEVARDDESQIARARWPLLASLDVEAHQDVPTVSVRTTSAAGQIKSVQPAAAKPVRPASKLPLFARGHRHATTPVPAVAAAPRVVGAPRFAPAVKVEDEPEATGPAAPAQPSASQLMNPAPVASAGERQAAAAKGILGRAASTASTDKAVAVAPSTPVAATPASMAPAPTSAPAANSILGQMFRATPAPAVAEPEVKGDLSRLFRRLETPREPEPASKAPATGAPVAGSNILGRTRFDAARKQS
ncbi:cellulose biosynthesis protein BcsP [Trinickia sp. YCB016]